MSWLRRLAAHYRDSCRGLPATTWLLCLAAFVNRAGAMVVPFLSLYLGERFGYSVGEAGRLLSLYGIGAILGSLLGGRLADRLGPVRVQVVTLSATGVWMLVLTQVQHPWLLAGSVFVLGVVNDAFRPGNITAVGASCEPLLRRKALALNRLALNAGWAIGPTVGGHLADVDFRWLFVADGATCGLAAGLVWLFLRRWRPAVAPSTTPDAGKGLGAVRRDRRFVGAMVCCVLYLVVFIQYFSTESRWLAETFGYDKKTIGWFLAINPVLIVLLELPVVHALRRRAALPIVALGALVTGTAFLLLLPPLGALGVVLSMVVLTIGEVLQMPQLGAWVYDRAPAHARGAYNGVYTSTFSLGFVLAPWLGGELYDAAGPAALWWTCGGLGALSALGFLAVHRGERTPPAPPR
ncbi:MAG: MFS transporter [Planctomycetes bacterium]|nr:MFS transporter [Planctomycetota bacterium]